MKRHLGFVLLGGFALLAVTRRLGGDEKCVEGVGDDSELRLADDAELLLLDELRASRRADQARDLKRVIGTCAAFYLLWQIAGNWAIVRSRLDQPDFLSGWTGYQFDANLRDADAVVVVTAMLALVASLTIAVTAATWRGQATSQRDDVIIQLWSRDVSAIGKAASAVALAGALTRLGHGGYISALLIIALLTMWLAVVAVQRTRDTVPLRLQLLDAQRQRLVAEAREGLLSGVVNPEEKLRRVRLAALAFLLWGMCYTVMFVGLVYSNPYSDHDRNALQYAAWLALPSLHYSLLYAVFAGIWVGALWVAHIPFREAERRYGKLAWAIVIGLIAYLTWQTYATERDGGTGSDLVFDVATFLIQFGALWILVRRGRTGKGLGRVLFQTTQHSRYVELVRLKGVEDRLMHQLRARESGWSRHEVMS